MKLVDDLEPERRGEQRPVLEHIVPRQASAAQSLDTPETSQIAAAELDPPAMTPERTGTGRTIVSHDFRHL